MTNEHEEQLYKVVIWAKMRYLTQRTLDYEDADIHEIETVAEWYE